MTISPMLDRIRCFTATSGTGTITVGAAYSASFLAPSDVSAVNGATYTYVLEQGNDFEIGRGVYATSGTTLTRATVLVSKISGSVGTTKITLDGSATVRFVLAAEDVNDLAAAVALLAPLASPIFTGTPVGPTASSGTNTTQLASTAFVHGAVADLINASPGALDTLKELADAIGDDANFAATMTTALAAKASLTGAETLTNKTLTAPKIVNNDFIADGNGNALLTFVTATTAVNGFTVTNSATTSKPSFVATGTDTNIGMDLSSKGTGTISFWTGNKARHVLDLLDTASSVNYVSITPAAATSGPTIAALGSDTNIPLTLAAKGTGAILLGQASSTEIRHVADQPITDSSGNAFFKFTKAASAVNWVQVGNAATGGAVTFAAAGSDSNIQVTLSGKGTKGVAILNGFVEKEVTLADGTTVALDASLGNIFDLAAGGNRTILAPTNPQGDGQKIIIRHLASGGARTLALTTGANGFAFGSDITSITATASGKYDYIGAVWNATSTHWEVVSFTKGF